VEALCEAHERQKAKHRQTRRVVWVSVIASVNFAACRLSRTHFQGADFKTDEKFFQDWTSEEGITGVLSEGERGLVFTVDTTDPSRNGSLVRFALADGETGDEYAVGLLVLNPDPFNEGHYVASARFNSDVTLPKNCQPHLDFVRLESTQSPDYDALLEAVSAADEDADRRAWSDWAQREAETGRLSQEKAEEICQQATHTNLK
jgi:hypothetical protein